MKHKIKIFSDNPRGHIVGRLWYVHCANNACGDRFVLPVRHPGTGTVYFGRSTWDAALAVGVGHLREKCTHE